MNYGKTMNWIERNKRNMIEKEIKKYIVANADTGNYLKVELRNKKYDFVDNIEMATKTMDRSSANVIIGRFYSDVSANDQNLVVIPLKITYELIEEEEHEETKSDMDILAEYINMMNSKPEEIELRNGETAYIQWDN